MDTEKRTLTLNREDWTGREISIEVTGDMRFEYCEDHFQLVPRKLHNDDPEGSKYFLRAYDVVSPAWEHPLFAVSKFDGDERWEACHMGLTRDHEDPVAAAILMLCMTL